jgi:hypothetical protein
MPHRSSFRGAIPFVPLAAGMCLSVWRFRAGDSLSGLVFALVGMALMLVVASWLFRSADPE